MEVVEYLTICVFILFIIWCVYKQYQAISVKNRRIKAREELDKALAFASSLKTEDNQINPCDLDEPVSSVVEEPFPIGDALKRLQEEVPSDDDDVNELDEYTKAVVKEQEKQDRDLERWLALDYLFNDSI